jgi:hypothetical protein
MRKPTRKFTFSLETSLSILAVVSSFCAIGLTMYQIHLQRTEHYAAALPYLMITTSNMPADKIPCYALSISNKGVGLAKIEKIEIWYKEELIANESTLVKRVFAEDNVIDSYFSHLWKGRVVSPGEQFEWIKVVGSNALLLEDELGKGNIKYRISFTSIYDEKWSMNYIPGKPLVEKVED